MVEEGEEVVGGEEAGRLIIGSSSGSGDSDRTWAREVPRLQKNGVESIGRGGELVVGDGAAVTRNNPRFLAGTSSWVGEPLQKWESWSK